VQGLLTECLAAAPAWMEAALRNSGDEAIGAFAPWWDIASARHAAADFRLFIS
jgi:urease accessory protein UreF